MSTSPRRAFLRRAGLACGFLPAALAAGRLSAQPQQRDTTHESAVDMITTGAQRSINDGLAFLAQRQQDDGSLGSGQFLRNPAICGLAGLAFMAQGSTPNRGAFGVQVERCVEFILEQVGSDGFIGSRNSQTHGPMYGHGFATLFLAECYGMSMRNDIREKLGKAVRLIVDVQNDEGGWRYQPKREDADVSVTICQVMALRAARNAGLFVPKETIDRCTEYVKSCQNPDGGFSYQITSRTRSEFPRSAAGVVALYMAGIYDGQEVQTGLSYLMNYIPHGRAMMFDTHYYYGHYYAVQAMWRAGGRFWETWYPAIRDELVARQRNDGSWSDLICSEYATAMACIILQIPNNFLPILQL